MWSKYFKTLELIFDLVQTVILKNKQQQTFAILAFSVEIVVVRLLLHFSEALIIYM